MAKIQSTLALVHEQDAITVDYCDDDSVLLTQINPCGDINCISFSGCHLDDFIKGLLIVKEKRS
jgi:hypothetical protein